MPVDHFTKEQFEAALPCHKVNGQRLWRNAGFIQGEHCYIVEPFKGTSPFGIFVRSSVRGVGGSAACGQDSIRMNIIDTANNNRPYGSKLDEYTTRVPGWKERMTSKLRRLAQMIDKISVCPSCSEYVVPFLSHTEKNPNRRFIKCCTQGCKQPHFAWIDPPTEPKNHTPKEVKKPAPKKFLPEFSREELEAEQEIWDIEGGQQ